MEDASLHKFASYVLRQAKVAKITGLRRHPRSHLATGLKLLRSKPSIASLAPHPVVLQSDRCSTSFEWAESSNVLVNHEEKYLSGQTSQRNLGRSLQNVQATASYWRRVVSGSSVNVIANPVKVAPIPKVIAHVPTNISLAASGAGL
jgi:hypothetical protein